jgi:hypothetical protein
MDLQTETCSEYKIYLGRVLNITEYGVLRIGIRVDNWKCGVEQRGSSTRFYGLFRGPALEPVTFTNGIGASPDQGQCLQVSLRP